VREKNGFSVTLHAFLLIAFRPLLDLDLASLIEKLFGRFQLQIRVQPPSLITLHTLLRLEASSDDCFMLARDCVGANMRNS
jgi:hypothetical protein